MYPPINTSPVFHRNKIKRLNVKLILPNCMMGFKRLLRGASMKNYNVAVVGATGMVGQTMIQVLKERDFPIKNLYLFASEKSAGQIVRYKDRDIIVEALTEDSFQRDIDLALFSAGGDISLKYAPIAARFGVVVIDNSSAFRMDPSVPLVVPEVNAEALRKHQNIIANPNCSTIQAMVAIKPLFDKYGISRIVYNTYQAVSGSGVKGVSDLVEKNDPPKFYPHPIANNCLPHIDVFMENGYTKEEMKMILETKKILGDDSLRVTATAVRVPIVNGHSESINLELKNAFEIQDVFHLLQHSPGIVLKDDISQNIYPLVSEANGQDEVFVGRLRRDESLEHGLNLWVVADNIRKGAASNAVQIAETLIHNHWL